MWHQQTVHSTMQWACDRLDLYAAQFRTQIQKNLAGSGFCEFTINFQAQCLFPVKRALLIYASDVPKVSNALNDVDIYKPLLLVVVCKPTCMTDQQEISLKKCWHIRIFSLTVAVGQSVCLYVLQCIVDTIWQIVVGAQWLQPLWNKGGRCRKTHREQ